MTSWWHFATIHARVAVVVVSILLTVALVKAARNDGRLLRAVALREALLVWAMGYYVLASLLSGSPSAWLWPRLLEHGWIAWTPLLGAKVWLLVTIWRLR